MSNIRLIRKTRRIEGASQRWDLGRSWGWQEDADTRADSPVLGLLSKIIASCSLGKEIRSDANVRMSKKTSTGLLTHGRINSKTQNG
jgi:hypothetical protein